MRGRKGGREGERERGREGGREERGTHKDRVPDEEDGSIVANKVPVPIFSVQLDSKATRVEDCVCTPRLST